jgi:hypothetical protein
MENYTIEDILEECQILAAQNKSAAKKRERMYLDRRNYLIGILHYKYGKSSTFIADIFGMDGSSIRIAKRHAYTLLSYNDITFAANACEYIQKFPYDFPYAGTKQHRSTTVVVSLDSVLYKKVKAYGNLVGDAKIDTTIKNLLKKAIKLWEE